MTVQQAEVLLLQTGTRVALRHRFGFDRGTILRLENYAMINIFDDGRYYIQGQNTQEVVLVFERTEAQWDPDAPSTDAVSKEKVKTPPPSPEGKEQRLDF
jgi:hypothetical protein